MYMEGLVCGLDTYTQTSVPSYACKLCGCCAKNRTNEEVVVNFICMLSFVNACIYVCVCYGITCVYLLLFIVQSKLGCVQ